MPRSGTRDWVNNLVAAEPCTVAGAVAPVHLAVRRGDDVQFDAVDDAPVPVEVELR